MPTGTIEQPHAMVNLRVGKRGVVAPFVSLAMRMPAIRKLLQHPHSARELQQFYAMVADPDGLVHHFSLQKHPLVATWTKRTQTSQKKEGVVENHLQVR